MYQVYIIGMGPDGTNYVTMDAAKTIKRCRFLTGAARILENLADQKAAGVEMHPLGKIEDCLEWIDEKQRYGDVGVLVSGDVHYYSLAGTILRSGYEWDVVLLSGISSYQLMADRIGITLEEASLCSVHGRNESEGYVAWQVSKSPKTLFLCSRDFPPERIAGALCEYGYGACTVWIGSHLAMDEEQVCHMTAKQASGQHFPGMSVVYVENEQAKETSDCAFLKDEDFVRGKTPMTKEDIRVLVLHKLDIKPWHCLWDLGAGTGSISIEMARRAKFGHVYSVEYKQDAATLIRKNKEKFQCENLTIVQKRIRDCMEELPEPDQVFLGGSEGELEDVISYLKHLTKQVHVVMTAVTLETLSEAVQLFSGNETFRSMQVQIGQSQMTGSYHTTTMRHPIWILEVDL